MGAQRFPFGLDAATLPPRGNQQQGGADQQPPGSDGQRIEAVIGRQSLPHPPRSSPENGGQTDPLDSFSQCDLLPSMNRGRESTAVGKRLFDRPRIAPALGGQREMAGRRQDPFQGHRLTSFRVMIAGDRKIPSRNRRKRRRAETILTFVANLIFQKKVKGHRTCLPPPSRPFYHKWQPIPRGRRRRDPRKGDVIFPSKNPSSSLCP